MSFTFNTTSHDTRLYDPARADNRIVAVYENDAGAHRAADMLREVGVPDSAVQVVAAPEASTTHEEPQTAGDQIMDAFMSLFSSSQDRSDYAHAVGRGHAMVIVTPTAEMDRHQVVAVLERSEPIDFDAKLEEWRQAGYEGLSQRSGEDGPATRMEMPRPGTQSRVRQYGPAAVDSPSAGGTQAPNATPGVQSSGMNSPRQ